MHREVPDEHEPKRAESREREPVAEVFAGGCDHATESLAPIVPWEILRWLVGILLPVSWMREEELPDELPRTTARFWILVLAGMLAITALGFAGFHFYHKWQPEHLAKKAEALFEKGENLEAAQMAKRALQMNTRNVRANRLLAQITEKLNSPEAVFWRRRVVLVEPESLPDILALSAAALRFGQLTVAKQALTTVKATDQNHVEYQAQAGALAASLGNAILEPVCLGAPRSSQDDHGGWPRRVHLGTMRRSYLGGQSRTRHRALARYGNRNTRACLMRHGARIRPRMGGHRSAIARR